MISKQLAKFVKSLKLKKYRQKASVFVVEGAKNVSELLSSDFEVEHLFITEKYLHEYEKSLGTNDQYMICSEKELVAMGTFQSNEYALAVARIRSPQINKNSEKLMLALDGVQDPGNLGTIVRIADWYGIKNIVASPATADFYNPKVINASMGSFTRVHVLYHDLSYFFSNYPQHRVYGTFVDGKNIHHFKPEFPAIILMGSESSGISDQLLHFIDAKIAIPRLGHAESLNVAVSTAIVCDNLLRN
jgi:TrmH family RNA methyltransferase